MRAAGAALPEDRVTELVSRTTTYILGLRRCVGDSGRAWQWFNNFRKPCAQALPDFGPRGRKSTFW